MEDRYCFICNTKIKKRKVDGRLTSVCMKCQGITGGYKKEEEYFVKELQSYFSKDRYWEIDNIVFILRKYLKIREV